MKSMDGWWDENQVRSCGGATGSSQYNLLKMIIKLDMSSKVWVNIPHELRIEDYLLSIKQSDKAFL